MILISGKITGIKRILGVQINQIVSHDNFFLHEEVKNFQAGNISKHIKAWEKSWVHPGS